MQQVQIKDERLYIATNSAGERFYVRIVDDRNKVCRRVSYRMADTEFIENADIHALGLEYCNHNTSLLFQALCSPYPEADFRTNRKGYNYVLVNGFRIHYESHGFSIKDALNYGRFININEFHNDYPTIESVAEFLMEPRVQIPEEPVTKPKLSIKAYKKEAVKDMETIISSLIDNYSKGVIKLEEFKRSLYDNISSQSIKNRVGRMLQNVTLLTKDKVLTKIKDLIAQGAQTKVPKFTGWDVPTYVQSLYEEDNQVYLTYRDGGTLVRKEYAMHQFLWRWALHHHPKAYELLVLLAGGEINYSSVKHLNSKYDLKLGTVAFDKIVLEEPVSEEAVKQLTYACWDILGYKSVNTPLDYEYGLKFAKGDELLVYWPDQAEWFYSKVSYCDGMCEVRYTDGQVRPILKGQRLRFFKY